MARLLIVHHTPSPATQEMFEAARAGAMTGEITGLEVVTRPALIASAAQALNADGYLLGTPANIGYMSGALKHLFDGIYHRCLNATAGRPYGLYVHGNSDRRRQSGGGIATRLRWRRARPAVTVVGPPGRQDLDACRELGASSPSC